MMEPVERNPRMSGEVKRYSTWPTTQTQTVAAHTWHVMRIYDEIWGPPSASMFSHLLFHDGGEVAVGDLPFPLKAENPELKRIHGEIEDQALKDIHGYNGIITDYQKWRLKICDLLEMWEFGRVEVDMGNKHGGPIVDRTFAFVMGMLGRPPKDYITDDILHIEKYINRSLGGQLDEFNNQ